MKTTDQQSGHSSSLNSLEPEQITTATLGEQNIDDNIVSDDNQPAENNQPTGFREESTSEPKVKSNFPTLVDMLTALGIYLVSNIVVWTTASFMGLLPDNTNHELSPQSISPGSATQQAATTEAIEGLDPGSSMTMVFCCTMLLTIVGILIYRHIRGGRGRIVSLSLRQFNISIILWGFILLLATTIVIEPLVALLPSPTPSINKTGGWAMLSAILLAPIFEEFLCRGIILESLRHRYGWLTALVGSSIFFALIHIQPALVVNALFAGLILGAIYLATNSIWGAILLHAMNNTIAYAILKFGLSDTTVRDLTPNATIYTICYSTAIVAIILSCMMIWRAMQDRQFNDKNNLIS